MPKLNELLADESIELHGKAETWSDAIAKSGALLEKTGAITDEYTRAMIENVEANGPYIVVAPGFAFAHARPSSAVKKTAISWLHLDQPVSFGHSKNDPVHLVVALAAQGDTVHTAAMKDLAQLLGDKQRKNALDQVKTVEELRAVLEDDLTVNSAVKPAAAVASTADYSAKTQATAPKGKILTVCGNGLGTSLFLKNTVEQVLDYWKWSPYFSVEATDTISAKGRAHEADFILTSGEIAATLGDLGVPVYVIQNFTSPVEIDSALRQLFDV
ncbi:PTS sugar transporter subunit IIA [Corynebacterium pseudotuberculosis]|uniref:Ascorbate-specific PTS system EIIA component n=1 Tax=Corynebacterium pseudotuberculosis (strain C231) TaxID=681645 RepID=D9QDK6_CORP2|nr:PTS sugar transporter subunit IIA [Corynebacterium pseudotuberculosis]ADK27876.1 PTS sugar transporter [Corynebacterium pseudotuberculosis FRC41]ADL09579.1 PTS transporter subunit EIIA [Corynebacterium pseudotuberculosis C231]ADL19989.1 PTS transporter subunit EIIA [Corynebacterium pseudotuberculosis 1002]ADO25377.1 PTS sugar transporter [Corynebacterium pseudotuberculosis I19]AEK91430.1 PTS system, IIA component [Corynebacterium pseudotuberculosis PAT10]